MTSWLVQLPRLGSYIRNRIGPEMILLPRLGAGMRVQYLADGTVREAHWDRPEDAEAAMREAGFND